MVTFYQHNEKKNTFYLKILYMMFELMKNKTSWLKIWTHNFQVKHKIGLNSIILVMKILENDEIYLITFQCTWERLI